MADILTEIEYGIKTHIEAMVIADSYNFDWGTVNEPDVKKQTFPSAEVFVESEECMDEEDGVWAGGYNQHVTFVIRVRTELDNKEDIPAYAINREHNKALEDLKRLFGNHYVVSNHCDLIMYKGMTRVIDRANDMMRPSYMDTRWLVKYTQYRQHPEIFSS